MKTMEITYKGNKYVVNYFTRGKRWFRRPYLEILKDNKVFYSVKSSNRILESYFCERGIIELIESISPKVGI